MNAVLARLPLARARLRRHVAAAGANAVRPPAAQRFVEYGPDPLRVLLLGGGNSVGYGVERREDALDGRLGSRLAAHSGRGVIVNNLGEHGSRLTDQIPRARVTVGYGSADLIVWCPSAIELTDRSRPARWKRDLAQLLRLAPDAALVVLLLPVPHGSDPLTARGAARVAAVNRRLLAVATSVGRIDVVEPPAIVVRGFGVPHFGPAYYDELGARVADRVRERLSRRAPRSTSGDVVSR